MTGARTEARAERLEHRLLGGEPPRQSLDPIGTIADLVELSLNETTRYQRIARILDPAPHLGDVDQVDPVPNDAHNGRPPPYEATAQTSIADFENQMNAGYAA